MPEFNVGVEFEVYCACGTGLCNQSEVNSTRRGQQVIVTPCDTCLQKEYDKGYEEGYKAGDEKGYKAGDEKGYKVGYADGESDSRQ